MNDAKMCIRDRIILNAYDDKVFYLTEKNNKKLTLCTIASYSDRKGQERVIEAMKNLSLIHISAYPIHNSWSENYRWLLETCGSSPSDVCNLPKPWAVSYTHLDVYKRQHVTLQHV